MLAIAVALLCYVSVAVVHVRTVRDDADAELPPVARSVVMLGVLLHLSGLVIEAMVEGRVPGFAESLSGVGLGVMVAYAIVTREHTRSLGVFLLPVGLASVALSLVVPSPQVAAATNLGVSVWLPVHLGLVFAGVAGFFVEFVMTGAQWEVRRRLKSKRFEGLDRFPSLEVLDRIQGQSLRFGLVFLGLGVLVGVFWAARVMHHADWAADPKVWFSVLTWCWYAASLGVREWSGFHGRWSMTLSSLGFAALVFSFAGLDFITRGFHAYGP